LSIKTYTNCHVSIMAKSEIKVLKSHMNENNDLTFEEKIAIDEELEKYYDKNKHLIDNDMSDIDRIQEYVDNFMK
jgi:hypothetical protein